MKKLIYLFIFILLIAIKINADDFYESDTWKIDANSKYYVKANHENGKDGKVVAILNKELNKNAFCIEPEKRTYASDSYKKGETFKNFPKEIREELALLVEAYEILQPVALSETNDYYVACQMLIWDKLGKPYLLESKNENDELVYTETKDLPKANEILDIVNQLKNNTKTLDMTLDDKIYNINEIVTIKDLNNNLNETDYTINASDGISNIKIDNHSLIFEITNNIPLEKEINIEPITNEDFNSQGVIFWHPVNQSMFMIEENRPENLSGINLKLKVREDDGKLIIHKVDQNIEPILDETFFKLYQANYNDDGTYHLGEEILFDEPLKTIDGKLEISLEKGFYFIEEIGAPNGYLIDSEPKLIEIKSSELLEINFINKKRNLAVNIFKKDINDKYLINESEFSLYELGGDHRLLLLKSNHEHNLNDILNLNQESKLIFNSNNDYSFNNNIFKTNKNIHLITYIVNEINANDINISIEGFKTYSKRINDTLDPLHNLNIRDMNDNKVEIQLVKENDNNIIYKFKNDNNDYLIIRNKWIYDIDETPKAISDDYKLYKVKEVLDLYTINNDDELINDTFKIYNTNLKEIKLSGHNYVKIANFKNESIKIYNNDKEYIKDLIVDNFHLLDVSSLSDGSYYYEIEGELYNFIKNKKNGELLFDDFKEDKEYILCESIPSEGYEYGTQNPCILIKPNSIKEEFINISFKNKIKNVSLELFKTNSKQNTLLNGAGFDIYVSDRLLNNQIIINESFKEDDKFLGYFLSGYLNINIDEFDVPLNHNEYSIKISLDNKLIKSIKINQELNINGLKDGIYDVALFDEKNKNTIATIKKEVAKGKIIIDNLRYDQTIILKEKKAPSGYRLDKKEIRISFNGNLVNGRLPYFRINELIIIPPSKDITKNHVVKTFTYD